MSKTKGRFENWQGMNWIRKEKRLAIYLRDGLTCVYCKRSIASPNTQLTLDHLEINTDNSPANLVTACHGCNSNRSDMNWKKFAGKATTIARILKQITRPVDSAEAKEILERHDDWQATLKNLKKSA
jgi:5-methylcytosine-specific restriction endonuclease McrA